MCATAIEQWAFSRKQIIHTNADRRSSNHEWLGRRHEAGSSPRRSATAREQWHTITGLTFYTIVLSYTQGPARPRRLHHALPARN